LDVNNKLQGERALRTLGAKVSDEIYKLFERRATSQNIKKSDLLKDIISDYLSGGNAKFDRLSSSIEQLTHRVYASHNEMDLLCNKMIEVITGMHEFQVSSEEKFSERANRIQQAVNFCAANFEIMMKKDGSRDAVVSMWKSLNKITGISQSQEKMEGDESENRS
jgi:hypothetical protein